MTEPMWKGRVAMASRKAMLEALRGVDLDRVLVRLSPAARRVFEEPLLSTGWYAERPVAEILEASASELGRDVIDLAKEVGARTMHHQNSGLGRAFVALFATPARVVRYAPSAWKRLRNTGELTVKVEHEGLHVLRITGWQAHGRVLCAATWGGIDSVLGGMKHVRYLGSRRSRCVTDGSETCDFELGYAR